MKTILRVLVPLGAVTVMAGSAIAQQAPAQPPPPSTQSPSVPVPPASPSPGAQVGSQAQTQTVMGELVKVDGKEKMLTVKTTTGDVMIKYEDDTKVSGASRNTAGLATMSGSQVVVRYRKDGASNLASTIEVKPAAGAVSPGIGAEPRPAPGGDKPTTPGGDKPTTIPGGGDPSKPQTPRP